jgi:hypothetical protein
MKATSLLLKSLKYLSIFTSNIYIYIYIFMHLIVPSEEDSLSCLEREALKGNIP